MADAWFIVNVRDAEWLTSEGGELPATGSECAFDGRQLGVRLHVLPPGEPNGFYHRESAQEDFLVLSGECRLLVEGEERLLRQWDFFHCPPGTEHIFVGAGDHPCVIFMVGGRPEDWNVFFPVSDLAARYGGSAAREVTSPHDAYAGAIEPSRSGQPSYWDELPWNAS